jgi:hypothetical protein
MRTQFCRSVIIILGLNWNEGGGSAAAAADEEEEMMMMMMTERMR